MYYKVGKALLQSGAAFCIPNRDKWYYKVGQVSQSGTIFITKWYNNKVRQYRGQVRKARNSNRFWQQTSWLTPKLPGDKQFASWNSWGVELLLESKERTDHKPTTCISAWLVSLRNNYLGVFLVLETVFHKLFQSI